MDSPDSYRYAYFWSITSKSRRQTSLSGRISIDRFPIFRKCTVISGEKLILCISGTYFSHYLRMYKLLIEFDIYILLGGSVAEWLACWTQAQKGPGSNRSRDAVG